MKCVIKPKEIAKSSKSFSYLSYQKTHYVLCYGKDDDIRDGKEEISSYCPTVWICYSSCSYLNMEHFGHCSNHGFIDLNRWMWNGRKIILWKEPGRKRYFCLNEHFFVNSQVQYRSPGAEVNVCTSIFQLQDDLVWYYCYESRPRRKKRNLLKAMLKIKANFSVNLLLVTFYMTLYALSELVTRNQIFTIQSEFCKWNDRHRLNWITSFLHAETLLLLLTH